MIVLVRSSSRYVSLPSNSMVRNVSGACVCGWVYHASNSTNEDRLVSLSSSGAADNSRISLGIRTTNQKLYTASRTVPGDPGAVIAATGAALSINTLYHIAVNINYSAVTAAFYINGALDSTVAGDWTSGNVENAASLAGAIGASSGGARWFYDGRIDDVRVYNRILSANELKTIFSSNGVDGIIYGMTGRYLLNQKQSGFTCLGTESMLNQVNNSLPGTPSAGIQFIGSPLKWRMRTY